jgi:hypothetical protein
MKPGDVADGLARKPTRHPPSAHKPDSRQVLPPSPDRPIQVAAPETAGMSIACIISIPAFSVPRPRGSGKMYDPVRSAMSMIEYDQRARIHIP